MRQSAAGRRGQLDPVARIAGRVRSAFPLTRPERVPDTRPEHRNHPAGVPVNPTRGRSQYPTRTRSRYPTPTRSHSAIRPRIHSPGCHSTALSETPPQGPVARDPALLQPMDLRPSGRPAADERTIGGLTVGPGVKPVGEPDAGKPHVRFDERRGETESRDGLRHRRVPKGAGQRLLPVTCRHRAPLRLYPASCCGRPVHAICRRTRALGPRRTVRYDCVPRRCARSASHALWTPSRRILVRSPG